MALAHPPVTAASSERWEEGHDLTSASGFLPLHCAFWGFGAWERKRRELQGHPEVFLFTPASAKAALSSHFFPVIFFFSCFSADKLTLISNEEIMPQEGQELEISGVPFSSPMPGLELSFTPGRKSPLSPISLLISF